MKSYNHLYEQLISEENLKQSITNACRHKLSRKQFRMIHDNPDAYIDWLRNAIEHFENDKHIPIEIYDGIQRKKRTIIVPSFREQLVHHALINVMQPIFLRSMYEHSYGSIPGRGSHKAKKIISKWISRDSENTKYCLIMDVRKYFDSIPHSILKLRLSELVHDKKFLKILNTIIDVNDVGIPLGFYTSQWLANWYLTPLDHYIKETLKAKYYVRYMDDMVIFGSNKKQLHFMRKLIQSYLGCLGLYMKKNYQVFKFNDGVKFRPLDFMGFKFYSNRTTLKKSILKKLKRKATRISHKTTPTIFDARQMLSYVGWLSHTNTYNYYMKYVKPFVKIQSLKRRVSYYDRVRLA